MKNFKKGLIFAIVWVCIIFSSVYLFAHEYILLTKNFRVKTGETIDLHLFVADGFNIEFERPFQLSMTRRFQLITNADSVNLKSRTADQAFPILNYQVDFKGQGLFHLERDYAKISLDPTAFREYLKTDHIENVRLSKSETKPQRERYSRYIKCLVQSEPVENETVYSRQVGHAFEILLLNNPYSLKVGDWLEVQVFFQGKPLTGKVMTARSRKGSDAPIRLTSRTDKNGRCRFRISQKGDWFIHATHMINCPDTAEADWESFWTSYSFGV